MPTKQRRSISDEAVIKATGKIELTGLRCSIKPGQRRWWSFLTSPAGRKLWLGTVPKLTLKPGVQYTTREGTRGEIRAFHPGERIRLTWQAKGMKRPSTLQVSVSARQTRRGTSVQFHQEKLTSAAQRERMRRHWQKVLGRLEKTIKAESIRNPRTGRDG